MTMGIKIAILIWIVATLFSVVIHLRSDESERDDDLM